MANVIDKFVIALGLDTKDYKKGEKEASESLKKFSDEANKQTKNISDGGKKSAESFAGIKRELVGLSAALMGANGIKELMSSWMTGQAQLGRTARNLGMSTKELDAWGAAIETVGGKADEAAQSFGNIRKGIFEASIGLNNDVAHGFLAAGVKLTDSNGNLKDTNKLVYELADSLRNKMPQEREFIANKIGITPGMLELMLKGKDGVAQLVTQMQALSAASEENSLKAQQMQKDWATFSRTMKGFAFEVAPVAVEFMKGLGTQIAHIAKTILDFAVQLAGSDFGKKFLNFISKGGEAWANSANEQANAAIEYNKASAAKQAAQAPSSAATMPPAQQGTGASRGMRNNNPGNIEYGSFARRMGATGSDGRFAIFPTMDAGKAAMDALIGGGGYMGGGRNTIASIISKWAPSSENQTQAYINAVSKNIGKGANERLTAADIPALREAIAMHENGKAYTTQNYGNGNYRGNSTVTTQIGTITVQTQATDAQGLAKGIYGALQDNMTMANSTTGMMQ